MPTSGALAPVLPSGEIGIRMEGRWFGEHGRTGYVCGTGTPHHRRLGGAWSAGLPSSGTDACIQSMVWLRLLPFAFADEQEQTSAWLWRAL